jgi:hypothetical protein
MGTLSWLFKPFIEKRAEKKRLKAPASFQALKELKSIKGNLKDFESFLLKSGKIGIIVGARGSGKSALGMRILENIEAKTHRPVCVLGFNPRKIPKYMKLISNLEEVPNNSFLLVDESGISFSSRSSMSNANKLLTELILISRHKNISIIFITQNSANIEINTLRQADYLLLRKSSLLQLDFERKKIKDIYEAVEELFLKFKDDLGLTYIYSDVYRGFISNTMPSFWSESLSKSFSEAKI